MENYKCPHCSSTKLPIEKTVWTSKDKAIAIILSLVFFPAGFIFILMKLFSNKQKVCPDCKQAINKIQETPLSEDFSKISNTIKGIAEDEQAKNTIKESIKDVNKSVKDFIDSFSVT